MGGGASLSFPFRFLLTIQRKTDSSCKFKPIMPQKADAEKYRKRKIAKDTSFNTQPNISTHKGKKGKDEVGKLERKKKFKKT